MMISLDMTVQGRTLIIWAVICSPESKDRDQQIITVSFFVKTIRSRSPMRKPNQSMAKIKMVNLKIMIKIKIMITRNKSNSNRHPR